MAPSEDDALLTIKREMYEYKKYSSQPPSPLPGQKKKRVYSEKEMKAVAEAFKNLSKDNVMLKSSVRKLVKRDEENRFKISQFDNLANQYSAIREENEKLRKYLDILKYAAREKCTDKMFSDNHGGPGVF
jgi:septal ring factor EnvC (AmiA/AmiB activator)